MTEDEKHRHDFRNHLGIILGFSEVLLAEAPPADPRRGDLEEIHAAAMAALELLERLAFGQRRDAEMTAGPAGDAHSTRRPTPADAFTR